MSMPDEHSSINLLLPPDNRPILYRMEPILYQSITLKHDMKAKHFIGGICACSSPDEFAHTSITTLFIGGSVIHFNHLGDSPLILICSDKDLRSCLEPLDISDHQLVWLDQGHKGHNVCWDCGDVVRMWRLKTNASTKEWWNNIELISTFPISTHLVLIFQEHKRGFRTNWNALKTQRAGQEDSNNALVLRTEYRKSHLLLHLLLTCLRAAVEKWSGVVVVAALMAIIEVTIVRRLKSMYIPANHF
ncbi:hypothetical protein SCLCIDRAFT_11462 [Scleroderma citrinum Foug A]|uniref:Uncharacterized protein n=1 Tax=Scleroderma citrinum Foug A TaxID=1036808 RepID=A0A0C2YW68_9AGAM|nr:hypothetical protein SCLCIDRAFT_11462 [Scleroderma citrinum Foug A]